MNQVVTDRLYITNLYRLIFVRNIYLLNTLLFLVENLPEEKPSVDENSPSEEPLIEPAGNVGKGRMGELEISVGGAVEIVQRIGNLFAHGTLQNNGELQTAMLKEYLDIKANPMLLAAGEGADESVGAAARQASRLYELEKKLGPELVKHLGNSNLLRNANDGYKNDAIDNFVLQNEDSNRIRHRVVNQSGSNETFYALPDEDLKDGVLQDIIVDKTGTGTGLRRTIVHKDLNGNDKIVVTRYSLNSDHEWVAGSYWVVDPENKPTTDEYKIHKQQTDKGTYTWVGYKTDFTGTGAYPQSPEPIVNIGYYQLLDENNSDNKSDPNPLLYIERYGYMSNKWYGGIEFKNDNWQTFNNGNLPNDHNNRSWWQILNENLQPSIDSRNKVGFHELMNRNPSGSWDISPRPWRRP